MLLLTILTSYLLLACDSVNKQIDKTSLSKDSIVEIYIPEDMDACFIQLDKALSDSLKLAIRDSRWHVAQYHEIIGQIVNDKWRCRENSSFVNFFEKEKLLNFNDITAIVSDSYYRYLNGIDVALHQQIWYWNMQQLPQEKDYPKEARNLTFYDVRGEGYDENGLPDITHVGRDKLTQEYWEHNSITGWKMLSEQEYEERWGSYFAMEEKEGEITLE